MENRTPDRVPTSLQPEHDWSAASPLIRPALRPVGISGVDGRELRIPTGGSAAREDGGQGRTGGAADRVRVAGRGFRVVVSVDHLLAWGVGPDQVHAAAMATWVAGLAELAWTDEVSGRRKIVWLDRATEWMRPGSSWARSGRTCGRSWGPAGRVLSTAPNEIC